MLVVVGWLVFSGDGAAEFLTACLWMRKWEKSSEGPFDGHKMSQQRILLLFMVVTRRSATALLTNLTNGQNHLIINFIKTITDSSRGLKSVCKFQICKNFT